MPALIEVRKKEGEQPAQLLYRFTKKVKRSGILKEAKKRRFHKRVVSRRKRQLSAKHRDTKKKEVEQLKRLGLL